MVPEKKGKTTYLKCRKCGARTTKPARDMKISEKVIKGRGVVLLEEEGANLPITDKMCPKCENMRAYYWLQQTRSADEPPTQFFRCTKCKHTWREKA